MKKRGELRPSPARLTEKYIFALLVLFPLFVGFKGYVETTVSKFVFFAGLTLLWLALTAVRLRRSDLSGEKSPVFVLIGAYFALCAVSAICSPYGAAVFFGEGRFDGIITSSLCVAVFFGAALLGKPREKYLRWGIIAGALCCVVGVLQLLGFNPLWFFPGEYDYYDAGVKYTGSFFGTIGNADLMSAYLCLLLPIGVGYYIIAARREPWLLPLLALFGFSFLTCGVSAGLLACGVTALFLPPLLITGGERLRRGLECAAVLALALCLALCFHGEKTDGSVCLSLRFSGKAAVMLILAVFALLARLFFRRSEFEPRELRIFLISLSAVTALGALAWVYFLPPESGTLWELSEVLHGNIRESFGSSRIRIWRQVLELFEERPLLGAGPGTLAKRMQLEFSRFVPETGATLTAFIDNAHNVYLGILADTGLLSLLCYVSAQVLSAALALRRGGGAALCLLLGLICYWIQDFFGLGLFLVSPLMWLCWGLLVSELCKPKTKDAD